MQGFNGYQLFSFYEYHHQVPTKKSDLMYPTLLVSVRLLDVKLSQIKKIVSVEGEIFKRQATTTTSTVQWKLAIYRTVLDKFLG